jgi:hypothetical protein
MSDNIVISFNFAEWHYEAWLEQQRRALAILRKTEQVTFLPSEDYCHVYKLAERMGRVHRFLNNMAGGAWATFGYLAERIAENAGMFMLFDTDAATVINPATGVPDRVGEMIRDVWNLPAAPPPP